MAELAYAYGLGPYPSGMRVQVSPSAPIPNSKSFAAVIQLEECLLAKEDVVGSNPIRRSILRLCAACSSEQAANAG